MAWDLSLPNLAGVAAGLAIVAVGTFVLLAKPDSWLHRFFFLLALADGLSTLLYRLVFLTDDAWLQLYFEGTRWYFYVAFIALLLAFGLLFPLPVGRARTRHAILAGTAVATLAVLVYYALDHRALWDLRVSGDGPIFTDTPLANAVRTTFVLAIGGLLTKLTLDIARGGSPSHRRQSAYVLGGMALAYAPYATTSLAWGAGRAPQVLVDLGRPDRMLAYWSFALLAVAIVASAITLLRIRDPQRRPDARFALSCFLGVLVLTGVALANPTLEMASAARAMGLLAYPILLGYAIARYEVFDIDAKMRRATTVTLVAAGMAVTFIVAENALEGVLQETLLGGVSSQWLAGSAAALATAALSVPLVKMSRKAARRLVPELTIDELHERKLEIYRHSLAGALADGLIAERESLTLRALRESLGITPEEHERVLHHLLQVRRLRVEGDAGIATKTT